MLHTVERPFIAKQFPNSPELAIGIKYVVLLTKIQEGNTIYRFAISGKYMKLDIAEAIAYAKKYPPPNIMGGFLHNGILIVPLSICTKEGE